MRNFIDNFKVQNKYFEVDDIEYKVEYFVDIGEPQTYDYPGSPNAIDIYRVSIDGQDLTDHLSEWVLEALEKTIYDYEFDN